MWVMNLASLSTYIGDPCRVVDVACAYVGGHGELGFTVHHQVQLPAKGVLGRALGALLYRPSGLCIGILGLPTIDPALQRSAIQGHTLPKRRVRLVMLAHHTTGHVFDQVKVLPLRQLRKETPERGPRGMASREAMPQTPAIHGLLVNVRIMARVEGSER